jgi:hypothetical protein
MSDMTVNPADLQDLEQKAHRYDAQDGLTEFLAGIMFFFIARVVAEPHLAWVPALLLFPMRFAYRFFKTRFTYPRVGYVKLKSEAPAEFGRGVLTYLLVVLFLMASALWVFGDITSWKMWMKWMQALLGAFTAGAFISLAGKTRLMRHYVLVAVCLGWSIACSIMEFPTVYLALRRWALGLGLVCLVMGVVVFLIFLRTHPVRREGGES